MRIEMGSSVLVAMVVVLSVIVLVGLPDESFAYTPHGRITIDDNADSTPENGVTGGKRNAF